MTRALSAFVIVAGGVTVVGCSGSIVTNVAQESERARETLITALDAWKAGQAKSLSKQTPLIRFADEDQSAGMALTSYEIPDKAIQVFPVRSVNVKLVLCDKNGKTIEKDATYQVGLTPNLTVLRSDN